jgi:hypothetical protein
LKEISERLEEAQGSMAVYANEGRQRHEFNMWDKVMLNTTKLPIGYANVHSSLQKLQHQFTGPFTLGQQFGPKVFEITDFSSHWHLYNVFNVD